MQADLSQLALNQEWEHLRHEISTRSYPTAALTGALIRALYFENLEMSTLLLSAGADPNLSFDGSGYSPFSAALEGPWQPGLELLLAYGGDVNGRMFGGLTPLMLAVGNEVEGAVQTGAPRTVKLLRFLLNRGADPALRDDQGRTAADLARDFGWREAVELLSGTR